MNTLLWVVLLLVLGLVTGKVVGALTAFTRGPALYDLLAGGVGGLIGGILLRSIGPSSLGTPLLTLLTGVGAAFLASWLAHTERDLAAGTAAAKAGRRVAVRRDRATKP